MACGSLLCPAVAGEDAEALADGAAMSERKAIEAMESFDKDRFAVGRSVQEIMHILHDFIPRECIRDAEDKLFDVFFINGVELTSNLMRKEYEEWKKLDLNAFTLIPYPGEQR